MSYLACMLLWFLKHQNILQIQQLLHTDIAHKQIIQKIDATILAEHGDMLEQRRKDLADKVMGHLWHVFQVW